jgi:hypothetical protein
MFVKIQGNWPDYVFYDEYELMALTDLKKFILSHGHLPNMPVADEVEQEGIKTGETIRVLTEKVEELTLYLLKQQEEIEALKAQVEEQK